MMMDWIKNWWISATVATVAFISTFAVMRSHIQRLNETNKEQENKLDDVVKFIAGLRTTLPRLFTTSDKMVSEIGLLNQKLATSLNAKEVRAEFVSKDLFIETQKNIDIRLRSLDQGINKILIKLNK